MAKLPSDGDWFEVSDKDWLDPRLKGKRLKLLADAQVPRPVVDEIRSAGIPIMTIGGEAANRPDSAVLQLAQRDRRVLLALDRDFWDDRKHPLQAVRRGIIFVDESPSQPSLILHTIGLVYGCFAKRYALGWWGSMKIRSIVRFSSALVALAQLVGV
jgi:hypothetical protein